MFKTKGKFSQQFCPLGIAFASLIFLLNGNAFSETVLSDVIAESLSENPNDDDAAKISQLESVVSEQLQSELTLSVSNWLESNGVRHSKNSFEVNVDPLIRYQEVEPIERSPTSEEVATDLKSEARINRVVVEVNFVEALTEESAAGVEIEVRSILSARGYEIRTLSSALNDGRPYAHIEVNAPRIVATSKVEAIAPVAAKIKVNAAVGSTNLALDKFYLFIRNSLVGTTLAILACIILLVAFVLRQVRAPNSLDYATAARQIPPSVNDEDTSFYLNHKNACSAFESAAIARGRNLILRDSLAHMNFDQALSFLGGLDRLRRRAVLTKLPVHHSIKVRLVKALEQRQIRT